MPLDLEFASVFRKHGVATCFPMLFPAWNAKWRALLARSNGKALTGVDETFESMQKHAAQAYRFHKNIKYTVLNSVITLGNYIF